MKIVKKKSTENFPFYRHEKLLYVAWACFHNVQYKSGVQEGLNYIDM